MFPAAGAGAAFARGNPPSRDSVHDSPATQGRVPVGSVAQLGNSEESGPFSGSLSRAAPPPRACEDPGATCDNPGPGPSG
ncbi:hypothetical protein GCM10023107_03570 [Actinoplanes octamycinicus]|nr:hypothetical protein Aoc01nite_69420 [Actinoplanes octamycinicus]